MEEKQVAVDGPCVTGSGIGLSRGMDTIVIQRVSNGWNVKMEPVPFHVPIDKTSAVAVTEKQLIKIVRDMVKTNGPKPA